MELRQYWNVIWKRRWLVLVIVGLAALMSTALALTAAKTYRGDIHFTARQDPVPEDPNSPVFTYERYYNWYSSEFLVDDYTQIVQSDAFAGSVLDTAKREAAAGRPQQTGMDFTRLQSDLERLKTKDVLDETGTDRRQRELHIFVTTPSRDLTIALLNASAIVLTQGPVKVILGQVKDKPLFGLIDNIDRTSLQSNASREITNAATRVILGIVVALALAFLLEYLDNSLRDERDTRRVLDLPVLGTIPRS